MGLRARLDAAAQGRRQILAKLEKKLDGAAQDVKLPLIGNALDAGADVVGAFNDKVVSPFNDSWRNSPRPWTRTTMTT